MKRIGLVLALFGCGWSIACGGSEGAAPGECPAPTEPPVGAASDSEFLAFASHFRGYHSWPSVDATSGAELVGIHDGSVITEYINRMPPSGSSEFPVGTLIIKEATGGTIPHEIFAMAKRGGDFNPDAPGWEWFEFENLEDGCDGVRQIWRGFGPPIGETYGADADAGCNNCHRDCGNDGVCATSLTLSNF